MIPIDPWWRHLSAPTIRADLIAGLLGAVLVLPQGIAFASLAGLPVQYGLYTAIVPCIVAALAGSSRHVMSGPTNATSLALYAMFGVFALFYQAALGFQVTQVYYFFAGFAVASVIMQGFVVGPVSERLGDRRCSNLGLAIGLFGFCMVPFVHTVVSAPLMMLPFAAGMALVRPCLTSLITDHTPEDQRGVILGTGSALDNVSGVVMPPIATGLLGSFGTAFVGIPSTVFALVALTMGVIAARRNT